MTTENRNADIKQYFVTCPKGMEQLLADELTQLGGEAVRMTVAGVSCQGNTQLGYRICLWSRLGSRVLLRLLEAPVSTADSLYDAVQSIDWLTHLRPSGTLSVDFNGRTDDIRNTHFGALKVKDAIVDQIRAATGQRPEIDKQQPELRVNVHLARGQVAVSLDLSGDSLHRRGYRAKTGEAPMKENLAAAVLLRAGWAKGDVQVLVDPMCGSATLLTEAALISLDIAPGLYRQRFGFMRWPDFDRQAWQLLLDEALARAEQGRASVSLRLYGSDQDPQVLAAARDNVRRAKLEQFIQLQQGEMSQVTRPEDVEQGLLVTNPPYGERLGETGQLMFLYQQLGQLLRQQFFGWRAAVLTADASLCRVMGLKAHKDYQLFNGALESRLFLFEVYAERAVSAEPGQPVLSETAQMFANRLQKNLKNLRRWVRQESIECYRLYDADIPEYAVAVDVYGDQVLVQEYQAPGSIDPVKAFNRLSEAMAATAVVLEKRPEQMVLKQRKRQQGTEQYQRHNDTGHFQVVAEHGCRLQVNLQDYLDTGLFLDHRPVRRQIQSLAAGQDFLNLFCYTATATVHAAVGGARSTTSVDMSVTYLDWARQNLKLNQQDMSRHQLVREDCFKWLKRQTLPAYDLIFMDPPTFSNSKRMEGVLDVQRDHVALIEGAMRLLRPDGLLIFSNNYRRFKLDYDALSAYQIKDVTPQTLDPDFKRNSKIHCCFEIRHL
ncbi:MAG: bifunctional 23S rRNA (guanine(2069)-N(7))-methyltransferase RlmK/23S rRNA (guanine(2445)-N(2))-methyltransferase RlmL [Nitrincola lacisaponensis]|uniref:bifunctional 23S rRNA (guanine(2069)-N(7))-methyltransferase RlmK/23S rRNA (guanine(2445)-N(2))-methyltransferase RlmL n=1 Tax=Nitrincola lacisaponensis TaxID=267850 RepID=UPI00391B89F3